MILATDRWADPGGKTLAALEEMIEQHVGRPYRIEELQLVRTVEEMRTLVAAQLDQSN